MSETSPFPSLLTYGDAGLPLRATALRSSTASEAAPSFVILYGYDLEKTADHGASRPDLADTALVPIGVATKKGIAWTSPVYEITLQLHLRFLKKDAQSEDLHTHTNPLQRTIVITFDPSYPEPNHGIVCRNNPVMYVDPSGHIFLVDDLVYIGIGMAIGALTAGVQSNWNPGAMAVGAAIGGISGGVGGAVGGYVGGMVGSQLAGVVAGGAAAGATAGGLNAAYYGGNIGKAMLQGAAYGAGSALVMYGAAQLYNNWASTPGSSNGSNNPQQLTAGLNVNADCTSITLVADNGAQSLYRGLWGRSCHVDR